MDVVELGGRAIGSTQSRKASEAGAAAQGPRPAAGDPASTVELSRMASLMNDLQVLEARAPDRYRRAMGSISSQLGRAADGERGGSADLLRALSRKFGAAGGAAGAEAGEAGEAGAARGRRVALAYQRTAAQDGAPQLEEILQTALAEVEA